MSEKKTQSQQCPCVFWDCLVKSCGTHTQQNYPVVKGPHSSDIMHQSLTGKLALSEILRSKNVIKLIHGRLAIENFRLYSGVNKKKF